MDKLSLYNEIYHSEDGHLLVFNRLSGAILKSNKEKIRKIFLEGYDGFDSSDPLIGDLRENGFIVSRDADENSIEYLCNFDSMATNELKLIIMPTYQCNFRCSYCYQDFKPITMDEAMAGRILKYVRREIHKYAGLSVGWYGGEPLLCSNIINWLSREFIDICHSVNRRYSAAITTNGYMLDVPMFRQMLKNRISLYQITLDGLGDIHDKDRKLANGEGSFGVIVNNLKNISANIRNGSFKIKIRSNMQANRVSEYDKFLKFLSDTFGHDERFVYWFTAVSNYGGQSIRNMDSLLNSFDSIYDLLLESEYPLNYSAFYHPLVARSCIASNRNGYVIAPDCSVLKCTVGLEQNYNKIGYIEENGQAVIDKNKLAKWLHYKRDLKSQCLGCEKGNICTNFACPKINNFPDDGTDCTYNYINTEKIVRLLCKGNYRFIKQY